MKSFITGICGFVGSQIAQHWLQNDSTLQVIGIENFSRSSSWRNRASLIPRGCRILHGDIRNASDLESVGPVDFVIDAAANASVLAGVSGGSPSRQLIENNLLGTINLLEHCKQHRAGFILLTTSRVYSIPPLANLPVTAVQKAFHPVLESLPAHLAAEGISEAFSTSSPLSLYGATKLASEQLALEYVYTFSLPAWINRCGVMAKAGQFGRANHGIFFYWLHSWKERRPLKYIGFGGLGAQVRDCLHPRDLQRPFLTEISRFADTQSDWIGLSL